VTARLKEYPDPQAATAKCFDAIEWRDVAARRGPRRLSKLAADESAMVTAARSSLMRLERRKID